ncbi:MAG: sigma-70 family RNA polymerase sigma factor [Labilithrix sp.]|nr:sigma-70 family RNA polymerase sigma factor [Labilithrix sp.]
MLEPHPSFPCSPPLAVPLTMASDFETGGLKRQFPPTRRSAVALLGSGDAAEAARAFATLVKAYTRPVYAHVRLRWNRSPADARDLTQGFFARAFEKRQLATYDREKATFRTYLKASLDHFVLECDRADKRDKRGGGAMRLSLDLDGAEELLSREGPRDANAAEQAFETEWTRTLFAAAVDALETRCKDEGKETYFALFKRYVLEPEIDGADDRRPSYAELAAEHSLSVTDVTNYLAWSRRTFRALVLEELRALTASDDEWRSEARALLGVEL